MALADRADQFGQVLGYKMIYRSRRGTGGAQAGILVHDELGRASVRSGDAVWETAFRPVFQVDGNILVPMAFEAILEGPAIKPGADGSGAGGLPPRLLVALHRHNLVHRDGENLAFVESWPEGACRSPAMLEGLLEAASDAMLARENLLVELPQSDAVRCATSVHNARAAGLRTGMRLDSADLPAEPALADGGRPDLVRFDAQWCKWLDEVPGTDAILHRVIASYAEQGISCLVEGISHAGQLRLALAAGARQFEGPFLAEPVRAGRLTGWRPLNIAALLDGGNSILVLRR